MDGMKTTSVNKVINTGRYLRKTQLLDQQPASDMGEQVQKLLLDMNRTASDLTSIQFRLNGAGKDSQAYVSRRDKHVEGGHPFGRLVNMIDSRHMCS